MSQINSSQPGVRLFLKTRTNTTKLEKRTLNQGHIKSTKKDTPKANQTFQAQQNRGDSANILSYNELFSILFDRLSQIFCDGNVIHTYGLDEPLSMFLVTLLNDFQQ